MSKKKIGILTFYRDNFGSALQCYATKTTLEKMGYESVLLDVNIAKKDNIVVRGARFASRCLRDRNYYKNLKEDRRAMSIEKTLLSDNSKQQINSFIGDILHPEVHSYKELQAIGRDESYQCFISGSDQVLNASRAAAKHFLLQFTAPKKRIGFAVSFGVDCPADFVKGSLARGLKMFMALSVREESGKKLVQDLTGRDVPRLCDPVVLLTAEEWKEKSSTGMKVESEYIFLHFLNEPSDLAVKAIRRLGEEGVKAICFAYHYDKLKEIPNIEMVDGDPVDYLSLIANAKYICSDSFHTTMFSIIFRKQFFTFQRQYLHHNPQTSRITDLLERYDLNERFIEDAAQVERVTGKQYNCDEMLTQEREKALRFLNRAIEATT